jgi:hypothetical protein
VLRTCIEPPETNVPTKRLTSELSGAVRRPLERVVRHDGITAGLGMSSLAAIGTYGVAVLDDPTLSHELLGSPQLVPLTTDRMSLGRDGILTIALRHRTEYLERVLPTARRTDECADVGDE